MKQKINGKAEAGGCYLLVLRLSAKRSIRVGKLGRIRFQPGFYVYVGSAKRGLKPRIERHRRVHKKLFWHIDYFREYADIAGIIMFQTSADLECRLARAVHPLADGAVPAFGCSDCVCPSHFFFFRKNPLENPLLQRDFELIA
jgi:sugar fermentation stimulation protein A